jgi:RNA polymerase sigma-70 factor (ECF subfamily)
MLPATQAYPSEGMLAHQWRAGSNEAANELVRRHQPALAAFLRRRAERDIDDLVQLTLIACLEAVHHFEGRSTFKNFLFGIATNQVRMELRSSRSRETKNRLYAVSDMGPSARESEQREPQDAFIRCEEARVVAAAMECTPASFREVLRLFYWDDLSVEQIAAKLDLPVGTVKSRLARGRTLVAARIRSYFCGACGAVSFGASFLGSSSDADSGSLR